jgi:hypothetical protein
MGVPHFSPILREVGFWDVAEAAKAQNSSPLRKAWLNVPKNASAPQG